jgi:hypothetical protein
VKSRIASSARCVRHRSIHDEQEHQVKKTLCVFGLTGLLLTGVSASGFAANEADANVSTSPTVTGTQLGSPQVVTPGRTVVAPTYSANRAIPKTSPDALTPSTPLTTGGGGQSDGGAGSGGGSGGAGSGGAGR